MWKSPKYALRKPGWRADHPKEKKEKLAPVEGAVRPEAAGAGQPATEAESAGGEAGRRLGEAVYLYKEHRPEL